MTMTNMKSNTNTMLNQQGKSNINKNDASKRKKCCSCMMPMPWNSDSASQGELGNSATGDNMPYGPVLMPHAKFLLVLQLCCPLFFDNSVDVFIL